MQPARGLAGFTEAFADATSSFLAILTIHSKELLFSFLAHVAVADEKLISIK